MLRLFFNILIVVLFLSSARGQELPFKLQDRLLPFGLKEKVPVYLPKIGIALSGGGSRGFAHIGFLEALEKADIPIEFIVGTSMGSIIGGLYSAGYDLNTLKNILVSSDWEKFTSPDELQRSQLFVDQKLTEDRALLTFRLDGLTPTIPTSISSGQSISSFLNRLTLNAPIHVHSSFDELLYRFRAVSTDLETGKEIVIDKGSLTRAMRASSSVSFFLPPVKYDSLLLVDGGLVANLPALITRQLGSDVIIANNTSSPLKTIDQLRFPWEIANQLVSIPMQHLTNLNLSVVDLLVEPDLDDIDNNDFSRVETIYNIGKKSAFDKIPAMRSLYKSIFIHKFAGDTTLNNFSLPSNPNKVERLLSNSLSNKKSVRLSEIYFYLTEIFRSGDYQDFSIALTNKNGKTILHVNYIENPIVYDVKISGKVKMLPESEIFSHFLSLKGEPFNPRETLGSLLKLLRKYRSLGYFLVEIDSVTFENNTLSFSIKENPISEITVLGNKKTNKQVILREIDVERNKPLKIYAVEEGLLNLQATNLFADVEAEIFNRNGDYSLQIKVIEKSSNLLRLGLRIDNENFTQVYFDLREENLFGSGTELGFMFRSGTRKRSVVIEQKANRIFNTYLTYKVQIYNKFEDINVYANDPDPSANSYSRSKVAEYRQIYSGISLGVGTQAKRFGNLIVEGRYEINELKNKIDYVGETYLSVLSAIKFSLNIDSQNKFPYPTSGFLVSSYYETAQKSFGGDFGYTKFYFDYKSYFLINQNQTISPRFVLGFADETLPITQQFSLGGQYSFFGLRDFEYRGRQIFASSIEYRYKLPIKLFFDTYFKFRYDTGSIWAEQSAIRLKDLRHGLGATVSFDTPLGRADFSVGRSFYFINTFSKNSIKRGPVFFYFTIGY